MPRTQTNLPKKPKAGVNATAAKQPAEAMAAGEVLTLAEAAAYLRLPEDEVLRLVDDQGLVGRQVGAEWRFLKSAIQEWLRAPPPRGSKEAMLAAAGAFKDDPDLLAIVEEIYRKRGRPITEDGSYDLLHGLEPEGK
jgi:excisionase family DNA binding protein